jgi:hypothetical protein
MSLSRNAGSWGKPKVRQPFPDIYQQTLIASMHKIDCLFLIDYGNDATYGCTVRLTRYVGRRNAALCSNSGFTSAILIGMKVELWSRCCLGSPWWTATRSTNLPRRMSLTLPQPVSRLIKAIPD